MATVYVDLQAPGGREFDILAVFGQVDRPKGDPEGVSAQRE
jgi:hypothetical protein